MYLIDSNKNRISRKLATQKGASLLEVLIAILVISIGMLGVAALQATSLKNNQSSLERTSAVILTYSIIDRMRANRQEAILGSYDIEFSECTAGPSGSGLANNDLIQWWREMRGGSNPVIQPMLSTTACGSISCSNTGMCVVQVRWDDSRGTTASQDPENYVVTTRVQL